MSTAVPNTLSAIRTKVRRITGRPSSTQLSDVEIDNYINTFYLYDMPEHIKLESLRYNYQFTTQPNIPVYDFPTDLYLTAMPQVMIAGYQSFMTQSRQNFFRVNPELNYLQSSLYTGDGTNGSTGTYSGQFLINTPVLPGFKPNPPGAFSDPTATANQIAPRYINWSVIVYAVGVPNIVSGLTQSYNLVDDGYGNLFWDQDADSNPTKSRGTINYITGALNVTNFPINVPTGNPINVQYVPYVASRPRSIIFYQDQFIVFPIPDQAYTVSFECYKVPTAMLNDPLGNLTPQLTEWWQLLAYGASDKIFTDFGDLESAAKYRPLLDEQMNLVQRRTIVQYTPERVATIYTEQSAQQSFPFGNSLSGF